MSQGLRLDESREDEREQVHRDRETVVGTLQLQGGNALACSLLLIQLIISLVVY